MTVEEKAKLFAQEPVAKATETESESQAQAQEATETESFLLSIHLPSSQAEAKEVVREVQVAKTTLIQDIRQHIYDSQFDQFLTCFHISSARNGQALNDLMEIGDLADVYVVYGTYNQHEIKVHINRLRETMNLFKPVATASGGISQGSSFVSCIGGQSLLAEVTAAPKVSKEQLNQVVQEFENLVETDPFDFECGFPNLVSAMEGDLLTMKCLESISMSRWNPVPHHRKMAGDLIYLTVQTLEGKTVEVTGAATGFFLNASSNVNFAPEKTKKSPVCHSIVKLLETVSQSFGEKFLEIQSKLREKHPFEYLHSSSFNHPWFVRPEANTPDLGRNMDALFLNADVAGEGNRDWNEDLQAAYELPNDAAMERMQREQAMVRAYNDFVDAAVKGAMGVADKSLIAINQSEEESAQMFIHNNIFFSTGYDNKETFDYYGGEEASHVAISKDINGIKAVQQLGNPGVHNLGTALIDYKGQRILAQTIVPGILRKNNQVDDAPIQYGTVDGGKEILSNEMFVEPAKKIAKQLHLAEHSLCDALGKSHSLFTSVETKWVKGTDSRQYILDLYRTCPVDATFLEKMEQEKESDHPYPHKMVLLRHELINFYYEYKLRVAIKEYQDKVAAEKVELEAQGNPLPTPEEINKGFEFSFALNPDAFTHVPTDASPEQVEADKEAVRDASGYISVCISKMVMEFVKSSNGIPVDTEGLVRDLHRRGINMRYLGQIAQLFEKMSEFPVESFKGLLREEMVARVAKRLLRDYLKDLAVFQTPKCIAHFFNCLFSDNTLPISDSASEPSFKSLSSSILHARITQGVKSRFRYDGLDAQFWKTRQATLLRSICLKVGIQIQSKIYDFTDSTCAIFAASDILNIYPIVKQALPRAVFASEALEHGRMSVTSGQKETGLEIMREAISMTEQIYGPVHSETGQAYAGFAMFLFNLEDPVQAVLYQRRAVIVSERCNGIDSAQTLQQYMNLAYYEYAAGNPLLGLKYMKYALNRWKFLNTESHPDTPTLSANIGAMLQKLDMHDLALSFFLSSLNMNMMLFGPDHENTVTSHDLLTKAYIFKGDYRSSIASQKNVYKFYKQVLGEEDDRTKNSALLLKTLTGKAVEVAMAAKGKKLTADTTIESILSKIYPKMLGASFR